MSKVSEVELIKDYPKVNDSIDEVLNIYLNEKWEREFHEPERHNRFFISGVGFECMLSRYWSIVNPKKFNMKVRKKMVIGKLVHDLAKEVLLKRYEGAEKETKDSVNKNYGNFSFSGRPDMKWKVIIPIEIKSFNDIYKNKYLPNMMHIQQLCIYMDVLGSDIGYLEYVGKNNFENYTYEIRRDENIIKDVIEKHNTLSTHLKNNIEPEGKLCWQCEDCRYIDDCLSLKLRKSIEVI